LGKTGQYYLIKQDRRLENSPEILGFFNTFFDRQELKDRSNTLYVRDHPDIYYPDFIDRPLLLVSDEFKSILKVYHKDYEYRAVVLTERERKVQNVYWNIVIPETDCLSVESSYYLNKTLNKMVIDHKKTEGRSLFKITNMRRTIYIIRLDLAESILRRNLCGFLLEELESV